MLHLILRSVAGIKTTDAILYLTNFHNIVCIKVSIDSIGQSAYQEITAELIKHMVMMFLRKTLSILVSLPQHSNSFCTKAIGNQKFFEIELVHFLNDYAPNRNGGCILQGDT